jgi:glycosyltransferase involved in cell wall biosynthesis
VRPLRLAYVLNVFPKFSETFIAGELAELVMRGTEVLVLSLRAPADDPRHEVLSRAGLLDRTFYDEGLFREALVGFRPDLFHAHFALQATAMARELAREAGLPFTFTAHGYDIYQRPPDDFAARAAAAAAVVTVSEANARYIVTRFGVARESLHVIPCGIDVDRFTPGDERLIPPRVLSVARLVPVKSPGLLLEACAVLRSRGVSFRCVLLGDGVCRDEVQMLRRVLKLEEYVEVAGAVDQAQVLSRWRSASVGVLSSVSEGMPLSLMEAAACGVPVVAPRVGGVPELVEDGVTGLLFPPGDALALADGMQRLLSDEGTAREMGEAARRRAVERFSLRRQVDRLLELWKSVLPSQ